MTDSMRAVILTGALILVGCGPVPTAACTPGESVACVGPAGCSGGQVCAQDGSGYEACRCGTGTGGGAGGGTGGSTGGSGGSGNGGGVGGGVGGGGGSLCTGSCDDNNACTVDSCDPVTGCKHTDAANGAICGSTGQSCQNGVCQCAVGVVELCNDGIDNNCDGKADCQDTTTCGGKTCGAAPDQCHAVGICTGTSCTFAVTNGATCNDGNPCTLSDTCNSSGVCAGTPKNCGAAPDQCHLAGVCGAGGACSFPVNTSAACTPSDACYTAGICSTGGTCAPTTPKNCNDNDACTNDSCFMGVCSNTARNNGDSCGATNLFCYNGVCSPCTNNLVCTPANPCHNGRTSCSTGTSVCVDQGTNKSDGTNCSDNSVCTTVDKCQSGVCTGTPITCAAPTECKLAAVPACDASTGCSYTNKVDGTVCNTGLCLNGACTCGLSGGKCCFASPGNPACGTGLECNSVSGGSCFPCGASGQPKCETIKSWATICRIPSQECCTNGLHVAGICP